MRYIARQPEDWMEQAACRGADPELFFPRTGAGRSTDHRVNEARAIAICNTCPVIDRCAAYANATRETYGVWGGRPREEKS